LPQPRQQYGIAGVPRTMVQPDGRPPKAGELHIFEDQARAMSGHRYQVADAVAAVEVEALEPQTGGVSQLDERLADLEVGWRSPGHRLAGGCGSFHDHVLPRCQVPLPVQHFIEAVLLHLDAVARLGALQGRQQGRERMLRSSRRQYDDRLRARTWRGRRLVRLLAMPVINARSNLARRGSVVVTRGLLGTPIRCRGARLRESACGRVRLQNELPHKKG